MSVVYLVSCAARKREGRVAAQDLYISELFTKARRYVESRKGTWFILSALYGLLPPAREVDSYDLTLKTMSAAARRAWAQGVWSELREQVKAGDMVVFLAGKSYRENLEQLLINARVEIEVPMNGLTIGRQLQWLDKAVASG